MTFLIVSFVISLRKEFVRTRGSMDLIASEIFATLYCQRSERIDRTDYLKKKILMDCVTGVLSSFGQNGQVRLSISLDRDRWNPIGI